MPDGNALREVPHPTASEIAQLQATQEKALKEKIEKVVATGVQIVVGLTNDRQMQFQTGFEGDETDAVVNERFDRIMRLADRQKARYEIGDIEADLAKHRETLAQFREDRARIDLDHERQQAQRRVELETRIAERDAEKAKFVAEIDATILRIQDARQNVFNDGLADHGRSGRGGSYVPKGHVKANLERIDRQLETAKEHRDKAVEGFDADYEERLRLAEAEIVKADAEKDQAAASLDISIVRYTDAIVEREARLERCRALAEG